MIYFITARDIGRVKIGRALNPRKRLGELQVGSPVPLKLERVGPGNETEEARLHARFSDHRLSGEWFDLTPEIEAHMQTLCAPPEKRPSLAQLIIAATGLTKGTVSQILSDKYPNKLTLPICISVYRHSGERIGPLEEATDHEIDILEKFCGRHEPANSNSALSPLRAGAATLSGSPTPIYPTNTHSPAHTGEPA